VRANQDKPVSIVIAHSSLVIRSAHLARLRRSVRAKSRDSFIMDICKANDK
jgi:hypothetical protein